VRLVTPEGVPGQRLSGDFIRLGQAAPPAVVEEEGDDAELVISALGSKDEAVSTQVFPDRPLPLTLGAGAPSHGKGTGIRATGKGFTTFKPRIDANRRE
jgi:hypothetical protein